jgi:hypothetical protein
LNPDDKDIVTFLCNHSAILEVHTKAEGLKVKWDRPKKGRWFEFAGVFLSVLGAFLSLFFKLIEDQKSKLRAWFKGIFSKLD